MKGLASLLIGHGAPLVLLTEEEGIEQRVQVTRANTTIIELSGPRGYLTGVAVHGPWLIVWLGRCIAFIQDAELQASFEAPHDVLAIYPWEGGWLVIMELGVQLRSSDLLDLLYEYSHGEVIMSWRITEGIVELSDFNGVKIRLNDRRGGMANEWVIKLTYPKPPV